MLLRIMIVCGTLAALAAANVTPGCAAARPTFGGEWAGITKSTWRLTQMLGDPLPADAARPTLTFADADRAVGRAVVNRYFATYQQDGFGHLTFGVVGSTRMAAPGDPAAMRREQQYLDTLSRVGFYALQGDTLTLYAEDEEPLLGFERAADVTSNSVER